MSDGPLTEAQLGFLDERVAGVLGTVSKAGRSRQSVVYYWRDDDRLYVSSERDRLKTRDIERTGTASLCVLGDERPFPSMTVSGPARVLTEDIGPATARIMQRIAGLEEAPEPQTDEALAEVGRVVLELTIERVGPVSYLD